MFFQSIGKKVDSLFQLIENAGSSDMANQLAVLITVWITIIIMIKGYMTLAGKSQDPIRELVWDISIKVIIMVFVLNIDGYLTLVIDAMNALHSWVGGGENLYAKLDALLAKTKVLADSLYDADTSIVPLSGAIAKVLVYLGFGAGAMPAMFVVIITEFVLKLVIMLAPFMFFTLMSGWLKNMFTQWLSIFFSNLLTVLIVTLLFNGILDQFSSFIRISQNQLNSGLDLIYIGFQVLVVGIVMYVLISIAKDLAEKIATVGFEGAMQSALGTSIRNSSRGARAAGSGAFSTYNAGKKGYGAVKNKINKWRGR
ncbi:MAG: type IV secretion system protein [Sulfurovaceae bacterium]|nr:type IV secretion system protein [Sulfurovaceae bacterium]